MYNKVDKFKEIVDGMLDLYQRKQADYGDSAAKTFDEWGLVSFLVRMEDKMNRVINLTRKQGKAKVADTDVNSGSLVVNTDGNRIYYIKDSISLINSLLALLLLGTTR